IWDVRAGSDHNVGSLQAGLNTPFNQVFLTNGGVFVGPSGTIIGQSVGANSNSLTVSGPGSRWISDNFVEVGDSGSFNRMLVNNGGTVLTRGGYVGVNGLGSNNEAVVTGPGSLWLSTNGLFVGYFGSSA